MGVGSVPGWVKAWVCDSWHGAGPSREPGFTSIHLELGSGKLMEILGHRSNPVLGCAGTLGSQEPIRSLRPQKLPAATVATPERATYGFRNLPSAGVNQLQEPWRSWVLTSQSPFSTGMVTLSALCCLCLEKG